MGTYKWEKIEYTCDHCGKKVMGADREDELPNGWHHITGPHTHKSKSGGMRSSKNINYYACCIGCMIEVIGDNAP